MLSPTFNPLYRWATLYASIRVTNLFLEKTAQFSPKRQAEITGMERMKGEVHFLRAWFYMELFKRYGGVPKIDRVLQITDDLNIPRSSAAEISFIVSGCEIAALALPAGEDLPTQTGYYLAKTVDDNGNLVPNSITGNHYWIFMRYEETLLLYAEAQNEALSAPDQSVYDAINAVRTRPGIDMPPIPIGLTKVQMRERIRHERRIELAFEGQRFWDIKRWRIGEQTMKEARGMLIEKVNNVKTYKPFIITNRVYKPAFDLFPIPEGQIEKQGALVQNPGYN